MKKVTFTLIILLLSCCIVYGQISTNEKPISFKENIPALKINENTYKTLPQLDMSEIEKEDRENGTNGRPYRFGYKYEVNYTLENSGELIIENGELTIKNIEIFDVMGKSVHSSLPVNLSTIIIDISHLSLGAYFVKVITDQGKIVKKIVKQ